MTYFMAYVVLISAGVAAAAVVIERVSRTRMAIGRWVWMGALGAVVLATSFAVLVPLPASGERRSSAPATRIDGLTSSIRQVVATGPARPTQILAVLEAVLPVAWPLASLALLLAIAYGQRRLARERGRSSRLHLNGRDVLLTENLGPAVAGITEPVVFVPRWVLALDDTAQELLLAHEFEHVKERDTRLLHAGAVIAAIVPWNPAVWWMVRRLRLAVERDCDARVLASYPNVRRYADLLLTAASRPGISARLLAAHFGEYHSDLEQRIQTMTDRTLKWRPVLAAALVAVVLIIASCEAPRPEPLAPGIGSKAPKTVVASTDVLYEFQVEKPVTQASGSENPPYPRILREAGVEGEVLVSFVVEPNGKADESTFKVIRATHELFATAVRQALPQMSFVPAEVGGKKVKQLVQQPFSFSIEGKKLQEGVEPEKEVAYVEGKKLAYTLRREEEVAVTPNVQVVSIDGTELARSASGDGTALLNKIKPQSIHSIEVFKGRSCPATLTCPLIKIMLAKGRTLQR